MFIFYNNIGKNDICDTYMQISQNGGHRNPAKSKYVKDGYKSVYVYG